MLGNIKLTDTGIRAQHQAKYIALDIKQAKKKYTAGFIVEVLGKFFKGADFGFDTDGEKIFNGYGYIALSNSRKLICRYKDSNFPRTLKLMDFDVVFTKHIPNLDIDPNKPYIEFKEEVV